MSEIRKIVFCQYFENLLKKNSKNNFLYSKDDILNNTNKSGQINLFEKITSEHIKDFQLDTNLIFGIGGYILFTIDIVYILREVKDPNKFMKLNIQFLTSTYEELKCIEWVPNTGFFPNGKILFNKKNLLLIPHSINDKTINQIIGTIDRDISGILEKLNNNEYDLESLTSKSSFAENKKVDKDTLPNLSVVNFEINYFPQVDIDIQILNFIKKIYSANKSKPFILSEYELKRKINEVYFFSKGDIWTDFYPLRNLLNGGYSETLMSNGIFGLVSGIYIYSTFIEIIFSNDGKGPGGFNEHSSIGLFNLKNDYEKHFDNLTFRLGKYEKTITNAEKDFLMNLFRGSYLLYSKHKEKLENDKEELKRKNNQAREIQRKKEAELRMILEEKEKQRKIQLEETKISIISELDRDGNNEIDLVDNEIFSKLLSNNQKKISEIDRNYIQKFVKISIYLKTKKSNIQKIFESIKTIQNEAELNELVSLLRNQIHTYDLLVFHSLNMMTSLVEDENITFFEIYECFDQLGVFNSNWENEVSGKLTDIGHRIKDLMYSIYKMENKIIYSIQELSYINQSNFIILSNSINGQLKKIDSSVEYGNFMNKIKNYKLYNLDF